MNEEENKTNSENKEEIENVILEGEGNKQENVKAKIIEFAKRRKKLLIGIIVFISIFYVGFNNFGIGMSEGAKIKKIQSKVYDKKYDEATKLCNRFFSGTDEKTKAAKDLQLFVINTCKEYNIRNMEEFMNIANDTKKNYEEINALKIESVVIEEKNSMYNDVITTVRNTGDRPISYVKLNLFYKDKDGNIINSDWTNDSNLIMPGAEQRISASVEKAFAFDTVQVKLDNFRFDS